MSLLGAIQTFYKTSLSTNAIILRNLLGTDQLYADVMPPNRVPIKPFCVCVEASTDLISEGKSGGIRPGIRDVSVAFYVYGTGREQVEAVLEALEDTYTDNNSQLTITNRTHMATYLQDRSQGWDDQGWLGSLTLRFRLAKEGTDCA